MGGGSEAEQEQEEEEEEAAELRGMSEAQAADWLMGRLSEQAGARGIYKVRAAQGCCGWGGRGLRGLGEACAPHCAAAAWLHCPERLLPAPPALPARHCRSWPGS